MTANIDNDNFTIEHTYSFDKFLTELQDAYTILNNNCESHSENQMIRKILEKIKLPTNSEMDACR